MRAIVFKSTRPAVTKFTTVALLLLALAACNIAGDPEQGQSLTFKAIDLDVKGVDRGIDLSWSKVEVEGATYTVHYSETGFSKKSDDGITSITGITKDNISITHLTNGTTYYLLVEAINADGNIISASRIVSATVNLPKPPKFKATGRNKAIYLSWGEVKGATSYTVYYSKASIDKTTDSGVTSKTVQSPALNTSITGLAEGTTYFFGVIAINSEGDNSNMSRTRSSTTKLVAPHPSAVASIINPAAVDLIWNPVSGVSGYTIYYAKKSLDKLGYQNYARVGGKLDVTADNFRTIGDLSADTTYYFVVVANYDGEGRAAKEITADSSYIAELAIGGKHGCVRLNTGSIKCWGKNDKGQLGLSEGEGEDDKTKIYAATGVDLQAKQLSAGNNHSCAIGLEGQLHCWGSNDFSQLGLEGGNHNSPTAVTQTNLKEVSLVTAGYSSTCAVAGEGYNNYCWGNQKYGGLGNGDSEGSTEIAKSIKVIKPGVKQFALGINSGCAIDAGDLLWCWGHNTLGQVGNGKNEDQLIPVKPKLQGGSFATMVDGKFDHYCVVDKANKVQCWGDNRNGQLGINSKGGSNNIPQYVLASKSVRLSNVSKIATGSGTSCALTKDGNVRCWGIGGSGIGTSGGADRLIADTDMQGINNAIDIVAGDDFTCALLADRASVKCWGSNEYGQLGVSKKTKSSSKPLEVAGLRVITIIPAQPIELQANGKNKAIDLSWGAVTGATSYTVYYHTASFDKTTVSLAKSKTVDAPTTNASITGVLNGTKYFIRLVASNKKGDSELSEVASAITELPAPTKLGATGKDKAIDLSWYAVAGATSYTVYYHTVEFDSTTDSGIQSKTVDAPTTNASITGLTNGTEYYLRVESISADGVKKLSTEIVSAIANLPAPPANFNATGVIKAVDLSWEAVTGATRYIVYYSKASFDKTTDSRVISVIIAKTKTNVRIRYLTNGTTYYFRVIAINPNGNSALSPIQSATTELVAPHPSAATSIYGAAAVDLSWDAVAGATGYQIYYAKDSLDDLNGGYLNYKTVGGKVETTTDTSITIGDLSADTTYYFVVVANYDGEERAAKELTADSSYIAELDVSYYHSCVRLNTGSIKCWGRNNWGQLGVDDTTDRYTATSVPNFRAKQLSAGFIHSCAIGLSDRLHCWGSNWAHQLGLSDKSTDRIIPTLVTQDKLAKEVSLVSAGFHSTCAVAGGNNYCWGGQSHGRLGNGKDSGTTPIAQKIKDITPDVKQFALGSSSGCAIDVSDDLWCWGYNRVGQVGNGKSGRNEKETSPVKPLLQGKNTTAAMVAGRSSHYCVVDNDTKAQCWGDNLEGQLGAGSNTNHKIPQYVLASDLTTDHLEDVSKVAAGFNHSCAIIKGGKVRCWGWSRYGMIGPVPFIHHGSNKGYQRNRKIADTDMPGINNAIDIAVGMYFTCVLLADRARVKCWGHNRYGKLGDGRGGWDASSNTPVEVLGL